MEVAKWHVRRTSGAPKALAVALSFCRLLGLGCPKQALAKIATPRTNLGKIITALTQGNRYGNKKYVFEYPQPVRI